MTDEILDQKLIDKLFENVDFLGLSLQQVSDMLNIPLDKIEHLKLQYDLAREQVTPKARTIKMGYTSDEYNNIFLPVTEYSTRSKITDYINHDDMIDSMAYVLKSKTIVKAGLWHRIILKIKMLASKFLKSVKNLFDVF